jgi:hypothetical protein
LILSEGPGSCETGTVWSIDSERCPCNMKQINYSFFGVARFVLRASYLLCRHSTTWVTPPTLHFSLFLSFLFLWYWSLNSGAWETGALLP